MKIFGRPETTSKGLFFLHTKAKQPVGCTGLGYPELALGLLALQSQGATKQGQGILEARKVTMLPLFLLFTVVQMEGLLMPGLWSLSCQVVPVQGFAHRKKSCK